MDVLSRYAFVSAYNSDQMTRQKAVSVGVSTTDFAKCDTDEDGVITIEEILANDDVCQEILNAIAAQSAELFESQTPPEDVAGNNPAIADEAVPPEEKDRPFPAFFEGDADAPDRPERQFDFAA